MQHYDSLDTIHLRMHQVRSLKELKLSEGVFNSEALMLILNKKFRSHDGKRLLFKFVDLQEVPEVMERKNKVLSSLNYSKYKELDDLVIPDYQVHVDGELAGYAMPLVEKHKNIGSLLHASRGVPFSKKKELLVRLGNLIDKVDRVDDRYKMFFGDLNEYNFILDEDNQLKAIDLDSSYVTREDITPSSAAYYLLKNPLLKTLPQKYKTLNGVFIPSSETDLYSYNMIILDIIANHDMFKEDVDTFYQYLSFLKRLGVEEELIDSFMAIYTPKSNTNPRDALSRLDDKIAHKSSFEQFQKKRL